MKTLFAPITLFFLVLFFTPFFAFANHKAAVDGRVLIESNDPGIRGTDDGCDSIHYHGTLNGVADPDIHGCGHGLVEIIPHGDGDGETIPPPLPEGLSFPARVFNMIKGWFTPEQRETIVNVVDVAAEANGIAPPGTVSDAVDIVRDATPSIKENADNANEYFDTYEDAPDRDRYTLESENPEENAPSPGLYRWFWSLFE